MPPRVTSTSRSGSTGRPSSAESVSATPRGARAARVSAGSRPPGRAVAASTTWSGISRAGWPPTASRPGWRSPSHVTASTPRAHRSSRRRGRVDLGHGRARDPSMTRDRRGLRPDRAVVDGRDPAEACQIAPSATTLTPTGSSAFPVVSRWRREGPRAGDGRARSRRRPGRAGDRARSCSRSRPRAARAARGTRLDLGEGVPGAQRRVRRAGSVGEAVVEVAAVHLADEVAFGADPGMVVGAELGRAGGDRVDHRRRGESGWGVPGGVWSSWVGIPGREIVISAVAWPMCATATLWPVSSQTTA